MRCSHLTRKKISWKVVETHSVLARNLFWRSHFRECIENANVHLHMGTKAIAEPPLDSHVRWTIPGDEADPNWPDTRWRREVAARTMREFFSSECSAKAEAATFTCREEKEKYVDRLFTSSLLRVSLEACAQFLLEYFFIVVRPLISVWSFLLKPLVLCKALELQKSLASEILRASLSSYLSTSGWTCKSTLSNAH